MARSPSQITLNESRAMLRRVMYRTYGAKCWRSKTSAHQSFQSFGANYIS